MWYNPFTMSPQPDVDAVLIAAAINLRVKEALLTHDFDEAARLGIKVNNSKVINLDEKDREGMSQINEPDLPSFTRQCIKRGLASGGRER